MPELPQPWAKAEDKITRIISETVIECAEILTVPVPEIYPPYFKAEQNRHRIVMTTYLDTDGSKKFLIEFGRQTFANHFLKMVRSPLSQAVTEGVLRTDLAHEMYHIREAIYFPNQPSSKIPHSPHDGTPGKEQRQKTHEEYVASRSEYAARIFALKYIQNRKGNGLKDGFIHVFGSINARTLLGESGLAKFDLKNSYYFSPEFRKENER